YAPSTLCCCPGRRKARTRCRRPRPRELLHPAHLAGGRNESLPKFLRLRSSRGNEAQMLPRAAGFRGRQSLVTSTTTILHRLARTAFCRRSVDAAVRVGGARA